MPEIPLDISKAHAPSVAPTADQGRRCGPSIRQAGKG